MEKSPQTFAMVPLNCNSTGKEWVLVFFGFFFSTQEDTFSLWLFPFVNRTQLDGSELESVDALEPAYEHHPPYWGGRSKYVFNKQMTRNWKEKITRHKQTSVPLLLKAIFFVWWLFLLCLINKHSLSHDGDKWKPPLLLICKKTQTK